MTPQQRLAMIVEAVAVRIVWVLRCLIHDLFAIFQIRLWRTGPVCPCTP